MALPQNKFINISHDTPRGFVRKPFAYFDLDGTIRRSASGKKFIEGPADVELYTDVEDKLLKLCEEGYHVVGVTNQGGIAYGLKTTEIADAENKAMCDLFVKGDPFHMIMSCPFHPEGRLSQFTFDSRMRKPHYGMIIMCEYVCYNLGIIPDYANSFMVGDRDEDMKCAEAAGITFYTAAFYFDRA
jgi:D-glycero-D-manno-heptose 1,7-bisphosphate phosphatase